MKFLLYLVGFGLLIVGLLGGAFIVMNIQNKSSVPVPSVDPGSAVRIENLNEQLKNVQSKEQEARLRRSIADNTMRSDTAGAYQMLRDIAANASYPALERAIAIQSMGDIFLNRTSQSASFAKQYIFAGQPYASFVDYSIVSEEQQTWDGIQKLYEYANSIAPTPISEYRIAQWYAAAAQDDETNITNAKEHLAKGNNLLVDFITRLPAQDKHMEASAYWLKAAVSGELAILTQDSEFAQIASSTFMMARDYARSSSIDSYVVELLWGDLHYALFLEKYDPVSNSDLIETILSEIVRANSSQYGFARYLDRIGRTNPQSSYFKSQKQEIMNLAKESEDFATLLRSLNWSL